MKKLMAVLLTALLAASMVSGVAEAGKKKKKKKKSKPVHQMVDGSVAMMAPFPADLSGCYSGLHRRLAILAGDGANGFVGYHFDIDKKTWGKNFSLEVTGGEADVDLDITFYTEFGTQDDVVNDPGGAGAPPSYSYEERTAGGETGEVPRDFNRAIVCMYQGADATFTYHAGDGVKA